MGIEMGAIVVNALYPERFSGPDARRIGGARRPGLSGGARRAHRGALRARAGPDAARRAAAAAAGGAGTPVLTLPFLFAPRSGSRSGSALAGELERAL